jgi:GTPase SAR1 family protein
MFSEPIYCPKICLVGLPSSGKSTFVNSICNKRIIQSGVDRTTTNITHLSSDLDDSIANNIKIDVLSDDGFKFELIDLPGVSDSQDVKKEYDDLAEKYVYESDIIIWVSDSRTAFVHAYEKEYFDKLYEKIQNYCVQKGSYKRICILLSKYEYSGKLSSKNTNGQRKKHDEIDDDEDTSYEDIANRVMKMYENKNIHIMKYSSFSKIINNRNSSQMLLKLVQKYTNSAPNANNKFNLSWYFDNLHQKQNRMLLTSIVHFITSEHSFSTPFLFCSVCGEKKQDNNMCQKCKKMDPFLQFTCGHTMGQCSGNGSLKQLRSGCGTSGPHVPHTMGQCAGNGSLKQLGFGCGTWGHRLKYIRCPSNCNSYLNLETMKCNCGQSLIVNPSYPLCKYCSSDNINGELCNVCKLDDAKVKDIKDFSLKSLHNLGEKLSYFINKITSNETLDILLNWFLSNDLKENFKKISKNDNINAPTYDEMTQIIKGLKINDEVKKNFTVLYAKMKKNYSYIPGKRERFEKLLGRDSFYYTYYYYTNIGQPGIPKTLVKETMDIMPHLSKFDCEFHNNKLLAANINFRTEIKAQRTALWGSDDLVVSIDGVFTLALTDNIRSLFVKII